MGIWTEEYISGYDTFGIPLKLSTDHSADWYCDNIQDAIGINYFIESQQRWEWHSITMPEGVFDPLMTVGYGYQISVSMNTGYIFIGI
jgi:hypothetical protein